MTMTVMEAFPKLDESESGLMVLTKVKIVNFDAYGQKFEKDENEEILYFVISLSKLVKF